MRAKGVLHARWLALGLMVCTLLVGLAAVRADDTDDLIKDILRDASNRAKAAGELVKSAKRLTDSPAVQVRLCEKAYECGISAPAGYDSALAALDLLAKLAPARAAAWDDKRLEVHRLKYLRGDRKDKLANGRKYLEMLLGRAEKCGKDNTWSDAARLYSLAHGVARALKLPETRAIYERMRDAKNWMVVYSRLAGLKKAVAKNPDDSNSRKRLVETYMVDLDMPAEASKHVTDTLDPTLRKNVSLAAREASGLADADFLTLGNWYRSLAARTATKTAKGRLLNRARTNLKMYLEVHTKKDIQHLRVAKMLEAVEAELKRLDVAPGRRPATQRTLTLKLAKGVTMKLVLIPAGKFVMGSPDTEKDRKSNEGLQRQVTISKPFYMGITEVTQAQYAAVTGKNPSTFKGPSNPVEQVSWNDCVEFCAALSKKTGKSVRLPTEAEWEYACRAGTKTRFSFGDEDKDLDAHAWHKGNSEGKTHPTGQKKPNAWGLYDMHGNVWERCADWYSASYANAATRDPKGPATGKARILRGGSWCYTSQYCRAAFRAWYSPRTRYQRQYGLGGFRVVVVSGSGVGSTVPVRPKPVTRAARPLRLSSAKTQSLTVEGRGFVIQDFKDGARAYGNRKYVWRDVPKQFAGWQFTQIGGGVKSTFTVKAAVDGVIHIAIGGGQSPAGWTRVEGVSFFYTDRSRTRRAVFTYPCRAGQTIAIPQIGWAGGIVLAPSLTDKAAGPGTGDERR